MIKFNLKNNKGYTLLFAVIVSSIVLSVGISILSISKKEFLLASASRESVSAFYAADAGLECTLNQETKLSTSSPGVSITCANQTITTFPTFPNNDNGTGLYTFDLRTSVNSKACAKITLLRYYEFDSNLNVYAPGARIESRGYNMGWNTNTNECNVNSPNRVERAIRYTF
jgi:Tfp pilus assembly protein PilX